MCRLVLSVLLLACASPLFAEKMTEAELEALFNKWQAEENRTLEGWRVLDDITLIESLSSRLTISRTDDELSSKGPAEAKLLYGVLHRHGVGGAPRDPHYAARIFRQVGDEHQRYARALATWQFQVSRTGELEVRAIAWTYFSDEEYADVGETPAARALSALAFLHRQQRMSPVEPADSADKALANLQLAAIDGCMPARVMLAIYLSRGARLARDVAPAERHLLEAADTGYMPAQLELAKFYHYTNGVRPDLHKCRRYFALAAQGGCVGAARQLEALPKHELKERTVDALYEEFRETQYAPPPLLQRMVDAGLLGRKTGRGFYTYN